MLLCIKENFRQIMKSWPYLRQKDLDIDFKRAWTSPENYDFAVLFHNVKWHILKGKWKKISTH